MQYNQPFDQPTNPNAPYVNGVKNAGIKGSIVPAEGVEYDQREIVEVIAKAYARGYKDFTGTPCGAPTNTDLQQLRKALEGYIESQITVPQWYIDTTVTFTVHGAGANFPDLVSALQYLSKYIITNRGFVTLAIAAGRWNYGATQIKLNHPNADRILITGATMSHALAITSFPISGYNPANRVNDRAAAINNCRAAYTTELTFSGNGGILNSAVGCTLTQLLLTGTKASEMGVWNSAGSCFVNNCSCCDMGYSGFVSNGGSLYLSGFCSATGGNNSGFAATNGLMWHGGTMVSTSHDGSGFSSGYSSIISGGAIGIGCGNGGCGGIATFASLELAAGSQLNYNATEGVFIEQAMFQLFGSAGGSQIKFNGDWGLYASIGTTAVGPKTAFGSNASGSITINYWSTCYFAGSTGVVSTCNPAANNWGAGGLIVV
jgi:hypothetical protein